MAVIIYFLLVFKSSIDPDRFSLYFFQLLILLRSITDIRSYTLPFNGDFFNPFSSLPVINICFVSFFIDAGNKRPRGVILYKTFLYIFSTFKILSSSILICIGFSPPAISKFCCARIIIVSIRWAIGSFFLLPRCVIEKLYTFWSFALGVFPLIFVSWNFNSSFRIFVY